MAITDKNTLKSWFKRGLKPLESQFHAWMDSYWHKSEKLATSDIKDLENILNQKAEAATVDHLSELYDEHNSDRSIHKTSGQIRSEIVDEDIPNTISRLSDVDIKIAEHSQDIETHQDIRDSITNIEDGTTVIKKSEYTQKLGIEADSCTKEELDIKISTGDTKDNKITFIEAEERVNVASEDTHSTLFGKVRKWFSDLGGLAFKNNLDPLTVVYQNGATTVYNGVGSQTIVLPADGIKFLNEVRTLGGGFNIHGYVEVVEYVSVDVEAVLIGVSKENIYSYELNKIDYNPETGEWIPSMGGPGNCDDIFTFQSFIKGNSGYYRWQISYTNPVTLIDDELYGPIFYMVCISERDKLVVPVDSLQCAVGYKMYVHTDGTGLYADVNFKLYNYTDVVIVKLYEFVDGAWSEMSDNNLYLENPYLYLSISDPGKYKVVVTEGETEVSKEFTVNEEEMTQDGLRVEVISEYPADLSAYPDKTIFIKNQV